MEIKNILGKAEEIAKEIEGAVDSIDSSVIIEDTESTLQAVSNSMQLFDTVDNMTEQTMKQAKTDAVKIRMIESLFKQFDEKTAKAFADKITGGKDK